MNYLTILFLMIPIIILLFTIFLFSFIKCKRYIEKMDVAKAHIERVFQEEYNLLSKIILLLDEENKFPDFNKIDIKSVDANKQLDAIISSIKNIQDEFHSEELINNMDEMNELEEYLNAYIAYFNDNAQQYNKLIKTIPSNIVCLLLRYKEKELLV